MNAHRPADDAQPVRLTPTPVEDDLTWDHEGGDDPDFFLPARPGEATRLICRIPGIGSRLPQCR
ncbi:hypothetical protein GCM10027061_16770 [Nesterenkonia suensis]